MIDRSRYFIIAVSAAAPVVACLVWWLFGGVMLVAMNSGDNDITRLTVNYGPGVARFGALPPGTTDSRLLGRIGEGTMFSVDLEEGGKHHTYRAQVYFMDLGFFRTTVYLEVGDDLRVIFRNGKYATQASTVRR